jgi:hypothetical protein
MAKTNIARVILGGIVAGIVLDILGYIADGILLAPQWTAGMTALGKGGFSTSQMVGNLILGLATGIFAIWLYAAMRPRYGAGPKTAISAGLALWVATVLLPNFGFMGVAGLFSPSLTVMTTAAGIVECVVAALAGAALYKESVGSARSMSARA